MSLKCIYCGGDTRTVDTRSDGNVVKRKRRCLSCSESFYTCECSERKASKYIRERECIQKTASDVRRNLYMLVNGKITLDSYANLTEECLDKIDKISN